jgi:hypothetical protein
MKVIYLAFAIIVTAFTKNIKGDRSTIQIPKKNAKYEIVELYRVPYRDDSLAFPVPEEGVLYSNRLRMFCIYIKDSCLFAGIDLKKGNFIYKIDLKAVNVGKRIFIGNVLDFTIYKDTLIVLNVNKFKYYNLQLDSIGEQIFPPLYILQNITNSNYFLIDYMFTRQFIPGTGTKYEYVYDLKEKKYLDVSVVGEQFVPVTNCKKCNIKTLRDELYNLPGSAELGQSNRFIIYETANLRGNLTERKYRKIYLYDKTSNDIYNIDGIDKYFIAKDGIRPLTAVNDSQFLCVSINEDVFNGVIFKILSIQSPK